MSVEKIRVKNISNVLKLLKKKTAKFLIDEIGEIRDYFTKDCPLKHCCLLVNKPAYDNADRITFRAALNLSNNEIGAFMYAADYNLNSPQLLRDKFAKNLRKNLLKVLKVKEVKEVN